MKTQIARIVNQAERIYSIDSATADASYRVNLKLNTCTCPQHVHRLSKLPASDPQRQAGCKHVQACRLQEKFLLASLKAKKLSDAQLIVSIQHYQEQGKHEIAGACRCEQERRRQAARADAELKAIFA
ncbi:MAG: hypothetical protein H0U60_13245 [Blastocatellia bacterium]|nr:hypothetical protein [Blastocatellia bacterium]